MKTSQLFTKTTKETPKDETSFNAQALMRAGFVDKLSAGVYTFLPLGLRVLNKILAIIREEINAIGGQEVLMPALTPKEAWDTTGRWDIDVLFKLDGHDGKKYALGATHEEIVTPLAKRFVTSYKELPLAIYQIQSKFRNEKRAKAGLMRGREFLMKDLYSFHVDQADLDKYYDTVHAAYDRIFARLGLGDITYFTYATGGDFSKYSHEFQTLCSAGEDKIYICDKCHLAINQEIIAEQKTCPSCGNTELREDKAVEVGNIFKLGTKFSAPCGLKYRDAAGKENDAIMGCYGIGPSRLLGTIVEIFHDERGIIWPEAIAPFKVHLLSFNQDEAAEKIYHDLQSAGIEVLYDDRTEAGAGQKMGDADLIGCAYRVVVSKKTLENNAVELKRRASTEVEIIALDNLINYLK